MNTIRLMLIEEVRILREMLQSVFNAQPDIHVVARVHEPKAALIRAGELQPDVILLGILYREQDCLQLVRQLRTVVPASQVMVMDFRPSESSAEDFIRAGATRFVLQDTPIENMVHAVRLAAHDAVVPLGAGIAPETNENTAADPLAAFAGAFLLKSAPRMAVQLTPREEEVAAFICAGRSNKEIAGELHVSLHTVKSHVRRILEKMSLHSRGQLAAAAYRNLPGRPPPMSPQP